jgi:hypothetical protein
MNPRSEKGSTLMLVVALMGVISMVLLGMLLITSRDHRAADRDAIHAELAFVVENGLAEAMAKIQSGSAAEVADPGSRTAHVTASPGLMEIRRYDTPWNRGAATGPEAFKADGPFRAPFAAEFDRKPANPQWIPLFSYRHHAPAMRYLHRSAQPGTINPDYNPAALFNLNTPQQPFHPGVHYLSGFSGPAAGRTFLGGGGIAEPTPAPGPAYQSSQTTAERPVTRKSYYRALCLLDRC